METLGLVNVAHMRDPLLSAFTRYADRKGTGRSQVWNRIFVKSWTTPCSESAESRTNAEVRLDHVDRGGV